LCFVAAVSLLVGVASAGLCPQVTPTTTPGWRDILSNMFDGFGSPGTSFVFADMAKVPRKTGQSLPFTVRTPPSAIGAYDSHTFPAGPTFYSNSSGASIDCVPGLDPSLSALTLERPPREQAGCPSGQVGEGCGPDGDCTGHRILRTPASGIESALSNGITGIDYLGTFDGTSDAALGGMVEIVFFHQSADYLAQAEYGFYRDLSVPNSLIFYWQINANCTLRPAMSFADSMCTTLRGNRQPATYIYTDDLTPGGNTPDITAACNIDLSPIGGFGLYYYSMWIFSDGSTLKFGMSVLDPNTLQPVVPETSIDPNTGASPPWFPISALNGAAGYVTAGIARLDPLRNQTFSSPPPTMAIQRLEAGVMP
jgi:hypothetical protein